MKKIILIVLIALSIVGCNKNKTETKGSELKYSNSVKDTFKNKDFEPSGIAYCEDKLIVVSDEGSIYNSKLDNFFTVENGADLEGVTCNGSQIFVAEEGNDNILQISSRGTVIYDFNIDRKYHGKTVISKKGDGFEGLAFYKEDDKALYFFVANQSDDFKGKDKSAIFIVKVNKKSGKGKIIEYFALKIKDISGLDYKNNTLYFISDTTNKIYIADEKVNILKTYSIMGDAQEGIFIKGKTMYIADDEGYMYTVDLTEDL